MTLFDYALPENAIARNRLDVEGGDSQSGLTLSLGQPVVLRAKPWALLAKRLVDIAGAGAGLVLLSPVLVAIAVAIKVTSPGPVLLAQKREGWGGRLFSIYKFRTMHADRCDLAGTTQPAGDDPRITSTGYVLRRTSMDELPQLLNVLLGQMSLVGPRPHVPDMLAGDILYAELVPEYNQRHAAKPGLTGWAQANGFRGSTRDRSRAIARVHHDLAYIQNWSLALDFRIMARTLLREFTYASGS